MGNTIRLINYNTGEVADGLKSKDLFHVINKWLMNDCSLEFIGTNSKTIVVEGSSIKELMIQLNKNGL